jgi:eukaryotic-like serine/threonine-protein kinase
LLFKKQRRIDTAVLHQAKVQTSTTAATKIRGNSFLIYDNNSTFGIKIQYPSSWERLQYDNEGVLFLSPSESNSDKFLESFSMRVTPSNNMSLSELAESIDNYGQQYTHFQLIGSKAITINGKSAYLLKYTFTDKLFGNGMAMDIGTMNGHKAYVLSYFAEPAKFSNYLPTIKRMIESFGIQNRNEIRQPSYLDLL